MNTKEVLRYLGYRGADADGRVVSQIALVSEEALANANKKNVFGVWDCRIGEDAVAFGEMEVKSGDLARHLRGCKKVVLFAATLGTGADNLLRRYDAQDMEKAVVAQAVCAAMIEDYCDSVVCEASRSPLVEGLFPISRFSPGYGDFDISWQKNMLKLLDCEKRIALTLTDGYMLIPSKSVTAVVGFSEEKKDDVVNKCALCENAKCEYRQAG